MGGFAATTGARDDDRAVSGDRSHCRGGGASESASSKGSTGQKLTIGSAWSRAGNNRTKRDTGVEHLRKLGGAWVGGEQSGSAGLAHGIQALIPMRSI